MKILATLAILTLIITGIATLAAQGVKPNVAAGVATPGGQDGSVQFNDVGAFGGNFNFRYDKNNNRVIINGGILDLSGSVVRGVLVPEFSDSYDLGSESNNWAGLYLGSGEVIYFGNVHVLYQEVGGGDTYVDANEGKSVRIAKPLILNDLPTFDPQSPGHVWNDGGVLKISNG